MNIGGRPDVKTDASAIVKVVKYKMIHHRGYAPENYNHVT